MIFPTAPVQRSRLSRNRHEDISPNLLTGNIQAAKNIDCKSDGYSMVTKEECDLCSCTECDLCSCTECDLCSCTEQILCSSPVAG